MPDEARKSGHLSKAQADLVDEYLSSTDPVRKEAIKKEFSKLDRPTKGLREVEWG